MKPAEPPIGGKLTKKLRTISPKPSVAMAVGSFIRTAAQMCDPERSERPEWASLAGLRREGLSVLLVAQKARKALPIADRV